jgi:endonuclease I
LNIFTVLRVKNIRVLGSDLVHRYLLLFYVSMGCYFMNKNLKLSSTPSEAKINLFHRSTINGFEVFFRYHFSGYSMCSRVNYRIITILYHCDYQSVIPDSFQVELNQIIFIYSVVNTNSSPQHKQNY